MGDSSLPNIDIGSIAFDYLARQAGDSALGQGIKQTSANLSQATDGGLGNLTPLGGTEKRAAAEQAKISAADNKAASDKVIADKKAAMAAEAANAAALGGEAQKQNEALRKQRQRFALYQGMGSYRLGSGAPLGAGYEGKTLLGL